MRWVYNRQSGSTASATWRGGVSTNGRYEILAFIPENYATTTNAHYRITYYDGGSYPTTDRYINQNIHFNKWVSLGEYCDIAPDYPQVTLLNDTGEVNSSKRVGADAMVWIRRSGFCPSSSEPPPDEVDDVGSAMQAPPAINPAAPQTDISWLTKEPPKGIPWKPYTGKIEMKNNTFNYSILYPADWFIYEDPSTMQVQSFPRFETPDQAPLGFSDGFLKVDIGFNVCVASDFQCQPTGTPVVISKLSGAAQSAHNDTIGLTSRSLALQKGDVIFTINTNMRGDSERIELYDQIVSYMISSLTIDE